MLAIRGEQASEGEEQRQGDEHDQAHDELQGQTYPDVIQEGVAAGLHHERIGRRGEGRSETHAGGYGYGEEQREGTDARGQGRG